MRIPLLAPHFHCQCARFDPAMASLSLYSTMSKRSRCPQRFRTYSVYLTCSPSFVLQPYALTLRDPWEYIYFSLLRTPSPFVLRTSLNIMSSNALFFDEGSRGGYLFVKYLKQGNQGEAMIVRSIQDGTLHVRKRMTKLISQNILVQDDQGNEVPQEVDAVSRLEPRATMDFYPRVIEYTMSADASDCSIIYDYCNGGDLGDVMASFDDIGRPVPEAVVWYILSSVSKALAHIHFGWRPDELPPAYPQSILHRDVNASNVFLHYPDNDAQLPNVLLGDFGMAERAEAVPVGRYEMQSDTEGIALFLPYLLTCHHPERDEKFTHWWELAQPYYSEELLHWAIKLIAVKDEERLHTGELMRDLVPAADRHVREALDAGADIDLRWTKPVSATAPQLVPEYSLGPIDTLIGPYKWVEVDASDSRIIRELPGQEQTKNLTEWGAEWA
jgi:serine/threonine protein kinase